MVAMGTDDDAEDPTCHERICWKSQAICQKATYNCMPELDRPNYKRRGNNPTDALILSETGTR